MRAARPLARSAGRSVGRSLAGDDRIVTARRRRRPASHVQPIIPACLLVVDVGSL